MGQNKLECFVREIFLRDSLIIASKVQGCLIFLTRKYQTGLKKLTEDQHSSLLPHRRRRRKQVELLFRQKCNNGVVAAEMVTLLQPQMSSPGASVAHSEVIERVGQNGSDFV